MAATRERFERSTIAALPFYRARVSMPAHANWVGNAVQNDGVIRRIDRLRAAPQSKPIDNGGNIYATAHAASAWWPQNTSLRDVVVARSTEQQSARERPLSCDRRQPTERGVKYTPRRGPHDTAHNHNKRSMHAAEVPAGLFKGERAIACLPTRSEPRRDSSGPAIAPPVAGE